jgi:hypothetical protein
MSILGKVPLKDNPILERYQSAVNDAVSRNGMKNSNGSFGKHGSLAPLKTNRTNVS